jgi:prepilin peptidase CpaA
MSLSTVILTVMAALILIWAAVSDVRRLIIANPLPLAVACLAIINALVSWSISGLGWPGTVAALVMGFIFWKVNFIGAGDVKLASAALLWLPGQIMDFLLLTAVLGGLTALVYVIRGQMTKKKAKSIPYGPSLALAAISLMVFNLAFGEVIK